MKFGVQYYPEQWPEERWVIDAQQMKAAGVNTVRMGEFGWSSHEPLEGKLDFSWLERAIDLFGDHGIKTILCTCSRTPPLWAYRKYPGITAVDANGRSKATDHRYHVGLAHPEFIELSKRIDEAVIRHFALNPNVVAWQVDNEVGSNNDCFCDRCLSTFHEYLENKYGTAEALNEAWGSHFWSYRINDFREVPLPREQPQPVLEYRRFMSQVNNEFCLWRASLMHELAPGKPVTTNFQNLYLSHTDYHEMGRTIDVNGMNHYPARTPELALDYYRGARRDLWILEQETHLNKQNNPDGWMRVQAWMAIAHGATAMVFFRWRQCRWGREQFGDGILPHSGEKRRLYEELARMGEEIDRLGSRIEETRPQSELAIVYSYESRWAVDVAGYGKELDPVKEAIDWHRVLASKVCSVDAMDPHEQLSNYKLVIAPRLWMVDKGLAENFETYVREGGTLCLTAGSGIVDAYGKSFPEARPGLLRELVGISVSDLACHEGLTGEIYSDAIPALQGAICHGVIDTIHPEKANVLAIHENGWRRGTPAITEHSVGMGRVIYLGTMLDEKGIAALVDWLCQRCSIQSRIKTPPSVSVNKRRGDKERLLFLLNRGEQPETIQLGEKWRDAFTDDLCSEVTIPPVDVKILSMDVTDNI